MGGQAGMSEEQLKEQQMIKYVRYASIAFLSEVQKKWQQISGAG